MIVCHCAVVSDRQVGEVIASGATTLAQVCRATDAGRKCGSCVFTVKQILTLVRPGLTRPAGALP